MRQSGLAALGFGLWLAAGLSAQAQSAYVAGAIGAEVVRTTATKSGSTTYDIGSGEALGGAIRVGALVAPRFGVELEFFRPGEIESNTNGPIYLAAQEFPTVFNDVSRLIADSIFPSIIGQKTRVRATTTSALVFARQSVGARFDVVYLGGISFARVVHETEFNVPGGIIPLVRPATPSYSTRTIQYGVGPVVGIEGRLGMTEHVRLVAGLRLHALADSLLDGWMIRPSVGLAWMF